MYILTNTLTPVQAVVISPHLARCPIPGLFEELGDELVGSVNIHLTLDLDETVVTDHHDYESGTSHRHTYTQVCL